MARPKKTAVKAKAKTKIKAKTVTRAQPYTAPLVVDAQAVETALAYGKSSTVETAPQRSEAGWAVILQTPRFGRWFMLISLLILATTTLFWTLLSARLNQANADQLIDTYLFESSQTFHAAVFPGAHSFLIKWPIFRLMAGMGGTPAAIIFGTVVLVGLTLGVLLIILYRIERRPLYFGLLCLALASVLLLVPTQPYPGALLPTNFAMTTTRNIEYIYYLIVLMLGLSIVRFKSWLFVLVTLLMAVLIASDKLFAVLAIGSVSIYAATHLRRSAWAPQMAPLFRLLSMAVLATAAASCGLILITKLGFTHIVNETSSSPFAPIHSLKQAAEGIIYALMAVLTNTGTNPVHAVTIIHDVPKALLGSVRHVSIMAYMVNGFVLLFSLYAAWRQWRTSEADKWVKLSRLLLASTAVAAIVFVLTDHYYPVDSRYLTIGFFACAVSAASYLRTGNFRLRYLGCAAVLLLVALPIGIRASLQDYHASRQALMTRLAITNEVADEVDHNGINRLIGNYWDITPVKAVSSHPITVAPVTNCSTPQAALNSQAWFQQPKHTATAYLAVRDDDGQLYGGCTIQHIVATYGVPNERIPLNNMQKTSKQSPALLLLYPGGTTPAPKAPLPTSSASATVSVTPELVSMNSKAICSTGTSLTVVAHEDDDILFTNPDLSNEIIVGHCMRTVYLTAGDAGENYNYWHGREHGAEAAYARMYNVDNSWEESSALLDGHVVTVSSLQNVPSVSLVFIRLPDGNIKGDGFGATNHESLEKLLGGGTAILHSVDNRSKYTGAGLTAALTAIMKLDTPNSIRTQGYLSRSNTDADHSDHIAAGAFTNRARHAYAESYAYTTYAGYPEKELPANGTDSDNELKQAAFLEYAKFDGAVCHTAYECTNTYTYGSYLTRMYKHVEQIP